MKTLSVREVAAALDMTPRGVIQRLNKGQLKGTRRTNQFGTQEWLVYANKEIMQAIERKRGATGNDSAPSDQFNFSPDDSTTVEAEEIYDEAEDDSPVSWRQTEIERLEMMAEKLVKPLAERIEAQAVALREQEKVIEDQNRQLRLLPDFQKQAEDERKAAAEERKAAQMEALEKEALKKQVAALEEERQSKEAKLEKVESLETQVASLNEQLQKLQRPWWQKLFAAPEPDEPK
ncbi:MAG: hypothetical protein IT342_03420 [Candidatus Melainabacteria bacterium]|nr:hypothetical protein [Candidatus Melainabacteria bacterium]